MLNPYCLRSPIAPHIAAREEGVVIAPATILNACASLRTQCDRLFVEGVGGFRVPLGDAWDSADLARELALPVILVVGMRLGCISHALLTAEAIAAANSANPKQNRINGHESSIADNSDLQYACVFPLVTPRDGDAVAPCVLAGPTCDSADVMYEKAPYPLPLSLTIGDEVLIEGAGAYTTTYSAVAFNGFEPLRSYVI